MLNYIMPSARCFGEPPLPPEILLAVDKQENCVFPPRTGLECGSKLLTPQPLYLCVYIQYIYVLQVEEVIGSELIEGTYAQIP